MDIRWWILIWLCATAFVTEFFSQETSLLVQRFTGTAEACHDGSDSCLNLDIMDFSTVISLYSWAAALGALVSGIVIDRYGNKVSLWIVAASFFLGPLLYTLGTYTSSNSGAMALLTLGRIISGLSGGANSVISNRIKARWFFYKELGLSFAAAILFDRLGSACAFVILGSLLPVLKMRGVMWLAFGITSFGAVFILIISYLDNRKVDESHDHGENLSWITGKAPGTLWSVVRTLDGVFWSISAIVFLYYGTVAVFTANGPNFLAQSYGFSESTSSYIIGLVYVVGLVTPVVGHLLDRYGYREYWMIGMALVLFVSLFLFCIVPKFPAVPLVLLIGLGYAIIGSLVWTSFTLVVAPENVGFALGFGKFFHYTGTGTTTAIAGAILNNAASMLKLPWLVFFVFSTAMAAVCVVISFIIVLLNRKTGYRLTPSQLKRSQRTPAQEVTPLISAAVE